MVFFLNFSMVLGLLDLLQIFSQLYLIELLGLLRSGATWAMTLDISKDFDRVWHVGLLHKLKSYRISGQIFGLISLFLSNRQLWGVLDGKSSQEYLVNAEVPQGSIFGPTISYSTLMTFLIMLSVILLSVLMILLCILSLIRHLICGNNLNWLLNLNLSHKTLSTGGKKRFVDFNVRKIQLVSFGLSNNNCSIDVLWMF